MREYQAIDTLADYLTIDSRKAWAQLLRREGGVWTLSTPAQSEIIRLNSIGFRLDLDTL